MDDLFGNGSGALGRHWLREAVPDVADPKRDGVPPIRPPQPFVKGQVMRARRRYVLASLIAAVVVALTSQFGVAPASAAPAIHCPGSTTWDDLLQRCV